MKTTRETAKLRVPLAVAIAALVGAVLVSTPIGKAAKGLVVPRNSIGSTQLKADAVTGAKVKDASLRAADFGRGQLPQGPPGPAGAQGPPGPAGAEGPKGNKGDAATALWARVSSIGELVAGKGVADVVHIQTGIYPIKFDRDVTGCALVVSPEGGTSWVEAHQLPNQARTVWVFVTHVSLGTPSNGNQEIKAIKTEDGAFSVAVFC
jgi:hypothetical protein